MQHPLPRLDFGISLCSALAGAGTGTRNLGIPRESPRLETAPQELLSLTPLTEHFHESLAFMEIPPSVLSPAVSCALCCLVLTYRDSCGHFNHHKVLNKEPHVPLGKRTQKKDPREQLEGVREGSGVE